MSRTINAKDLKPLIEKHAVTVLDVRRQNDYDADNVKLPGAEWMNPDQLADWSARLSKEKEIVIYCARGGSVSNAVLDALLGKGFKARFIEGGIEGWKGAGGAVESKK